MRQFQTEIYRQTQVPPFGASLFHRQIQPKDESFLEMARFTFFPYFDTYIFSFFWLILNTFVFFYSLSLEPGPNYLSSSSDGEFLNIEQSALFQLGQNYPYHVVKNFHYYRVLTSMVLFCNFYHYLLVSIGVLTIGSYVERIIGFKRCLVLVIISGVAGILGNNTVYMNATLQSTTPVFGLIGYTIGYFLVHSSSDWKYYNTQKIHMILLLCLICFFYIKLAIDYSNVNILSNMISLIFGFMFQFADPGENNRFTCKGVCIMFLMTAILTIFVIIFFFNSSPDPFDP